MLVSELRRLLDALGPRLAEAEVAEIRFFLDHDEPECAWDLLWACLSLARTPLDRETAVRLRDLGSRCRRDTDEMARDFPLVLAEPSSPPVI